MTQLFANNAYSSLAANASNSTTTLTLATGTGARFPSPTGGNYFLLTLVGLDGNANESSWEIVKVTARSTDTLTVVRAQESTTAVAWNTGTRVESRATGGTFDSLLQLSGGTLTGDLNFSGNGRRVTADFSNATLGNRLYLQANTGNAATAVGAIPNGTGNSAAFNVFNSSDPANAGYLQFLINATEARLYSGFTGTGATLPMTFHTGGSERMRVSAAGNVGIGKSSPDQLLQVSGGNIDLQDEVAGRRIGFYVGDSYTAGTVGGTVATARYGLTFGSYVGSSVNLGGWGGLTFSTTDAERLRITNAGAIGIGGANYGTSGQVLTSGGPSAAPTWADAAGGSSTKVIANKTGAYTVVAGDLGKIINCTSGTFTVSLTAAASLGSGFTCIIWNTGTGAITIDPNASETIDGVDTLILRQGEGLAVVCNGTNWETDDKKPMRGYAENLASTSTRPVASGVNSIALGIAYSNGVNSFSAVVNDSSGTYGALGDGDIAIGSLAKASGSGYVSIALGRSTVSTGNNTIAIGRSNSATSNYSTAIGTNSGNTGSQAATGAGAMALGGSYASGADSFAAAIANNMSSYGATGANSIAMGQNAKASLGGVAIYYNALSSNYDAVAIGNGATASGDSAYAIGKAATASGTSSWATQYGTASALASVSFGGVSAQIGKYSFANGYNFSSGSVQAGKIVLYAATTTTTAVALTSNGNAASTINQLIVAYGQAMAIQGTLIAKVSGTGAMAGWNITGIVSNNAGTMAVSGLALTAIGSDSITLGAQPTIAVDNTNKGVTITSGYKSATSIRWVCCLNTSEVTY